MSGVVMPRQPEMSGVAMPRQPDVGGLTAPPVGLLEVPQQPRFEVPAAFIKGNLQGMEALQGSPVGLTKLLFKVLMGSLASEQCRQTRSEQRIHRHRVGPRSMAWETWSLAFIATESFQIPSSPMPNRIQICECGLDLFLICFLLDWGFCTASFCRE